MRGDFPPELTATDLWNAVAGAMGQGLSLGGRARAVLRFAPEGGPDDTGTALPVFEVATRQGVVWAQIRALPLGQMTRSDLSLDVLSSLPPALADAIIALAVERLVGVLGDAAGLITGLTRSTAEAMAAAGRERIIAQIDGGWGGEAELVIAGDAGTFSAIAMNLPRGPAGQLPEAIAAQIPVRCGLRMVGRVLALGTVQSLRQGDIILSETSGLRLTAPRATYDLAFDGTNWKIGEVAMNDDMPEAMTPAPAPDMAAAPAPEAAPEVGPEPSAAIADLTQLPVRLSFLLADRVMTLAEVQGLVTGAIVPFAVDAPTAGQPVRILANGKVMGEGHIVEVEGRAAVRIASLFGKQG